MRRRGRFNLVIEKLMIPTRRFLIAHDGNPVFLFQSRNRETYDSNGETGEFQSRNRETYDSNDSIIGATGDSIVGAFQSRNRETYDSNKKRWLSFTSIVRKFQSRNRETYDSNVKMKIC